MYYVLFKGWLINDPEYSMDDLRRDYIKTLKEDAQHRQIKPGAHKLYERVNDAVESTLNSNDALNKT